MKSIGKIMFSFLLGIITASNSHAVVVDLVFNNDFYDHFDAGGVWEDLLDDVDLITSGIGNAVEDDFDSYSNVTVSSVNPDITVYIGGYFPADSTGTFGKSNNILGGYYAVGYGVTLSANVYSYPLARDEAFRGELATVYRITQGLAHTASHEIAHILNLYHAYVYNGYDPSVSGALNGDYVPKDPRYMTEVMKSGFDDGTEDEHVMADAYILEVADRAEDRDFSAYSQCALSFWDNGGGTLGKTIICTIFHYGSKVYYPFTLQSNVSINSGEKLLVSGNTSAGYMLNLNGYSVSGEVSLINSGNIEPYICRKTGSTVKGFFPTLASAASGSASGDTYEIKDDVSVPSGTVSIHSNCSIYLDSGIDISITGTLSVANGVTFSKLSAGNWDGITINNGGTLSLSGDAAIEYASTGLKFNAGGTLSNSSNTLTIQDCTTGLYVYNCSPAVQNILFDGNSGNAIDVEYSTSDPTISYCTISDSTATEHAIYLNASADASLENNVLCQMYDDTIQFESAANIDMNGGHNDVYRKSGKWAIDNDISSNIIVITGNYWGGETILSNFISDANDVMCTSIDGSANADGVYKAAFSSLAVDPMLEAREFEKYGEYSQALSIYRDVISNSDDFYKKRKALKRIVRINSLQKSGYDEVKSLMEKELIDANCWYRAYLDCALCDIMVREGRFTEAVSELEKRSKQYKDSSVEVMMLAEMANISGTRLGDNTAAKEYADRAAAINPGDGVLRIAYAAAGMKYNHRQYTDRFDGKAENFNILPDPETYLAETATTSITITPNPANPATTLHYTIVQPGNVKLAVFNANGQKVATLVDDYMSPGKHSAVFDGSNLASGVYFYRLESTGFAKSGKMLLIK